MAPIIITDIAQDFPELVAVIRERSVFLLMDSGTQRHCLPIIKKWLPPATQHITIKAGEVNKSLASCEKIWTTLSAKNADRQSVLVVLGGGMVGDIGAFCAATYKRGIDCIQMPTSLLAMVDASLGGKNGIDFNGLKNQIGTFKAHKAIWIYPEFLKTLPHGELLSGFAEIIKHSLIANIKSWNVLRKKELEDQNWVELIQESVEIKSAIVSRDPLEKGERKMLNAGHTVGHAIESLFLAREQPVGHGFCIAAGLVIEGYISVKKGLLSEAELVQIEEFIFTLYPALAIRKADWKKLWNFCQHDKKNRNGEVLLALTGPIGSCTVDVAVSETEFKEALWYYLG